MDFTPTIGLKQALSTSWSTWQKNVLDMPVVAEVLNAGKQVISAVLTVGLRISTTLARDGETLDSLRGQVLSLQREVSQLRVQKANHQFKSALAGTLNASPASLLGKRKGADAPASRKRLALEGHRLLRSLHEISVNKADEAAGNSSAPANSVYVAPPEKKLTLLLPSMCPTDLAAKNARINAAFLEVVPSPCVSSSSSSLISADSSGSSAASVEAASMSKGRGDSGRKRRRRVSFGGDDVREVQNYIADEDTANFDARLEDIVPFEQAEVDLVDEVGGSGAAPREPETVAEAAALNAVEARKLPFGIQDLLGASLRPAQKRRLSLDRIAAKIQSKQVSHKPLSFSAADFLQVQLRPVQQASSHRVQGAPQLNLHDSFRAALLAKFSRTMPTTPRTPGDESDAEWL